MTPEDSNEPASRLPMAAVQEAIASYDSIIDTNKARLAAAVRHAVEGHSEFTRTITTLASGALVLSISIVQFMAPRLSHPRLGILLPSAWICFGITVVVAAFRVTWLQGAQSYEVNMESARADLAMKIRQRPTQTELSSFIDEHISPQFDVAAKTVRFHTILDRTQAASAWCFAAGMVALLTFAIANLPF